MSRESAASIISATTSVAKVRGFTVSLLFHLEGRELRTMDLVDLTGKYHQYVSMYLSRMRNYELVEKYGCCWRLSENGASFLSYLRSLSDDNIIIQQKENRKKTFGKQKENTSDPKRLKQVSFDLWLQNSSLDDAEKEVVEVLVDHYDRTGGKFLFADGLYGLAQRLNQNPSDLPQALRKLVEDNIIYVWKPRAATGYLKIGLKRAFIQTLERERQ